MHYRLLLPRTVKQFLNLFVAFSAFSADSQTMMKLPAGSDAVIDRFSDLMIGYRFANAHIHSIGLLKNSH